VRGPAIISDLAGPKKPPLSLTEAPAAPNPSLAILTLAADLGGKWTPPIEKTSANHRHYRHDRHPDEEVACLSCFFGDGHRDDKVKVPVTPIEYRHEETPYIREV
jgi:hypothetical protein